MKMSSKSIQKNLSLIGMLIKKKRHYFIKFRQANIGGWERMHFFDEVQILALLLRE